MAFRAVIIDGLPIRGNSFGDAPFGLRLIKSSIRANKLRQIGSVLGQHILFRQCSVENRSGLGTNRLIAYGMVAAEQRVDGNSYLHRQFDRPRGILFWFATVIDVA